MKIQQSVTFKPVVITLETPEEVQAIWQLACAARLAHDYREARDLATKLAHFFNNSDLAQ